MSDAKWSNWIEWSGGECPLPHGVTTEVKLNTAIEPRIGFSEKWAWEHSGLGSDIIAYRYRIEEPSAISEIDEEECLQLAYERMSKTNESTSDGSTASYYELPEGCTELQDLISYRNLNAQDGEMFRAIYRKGRASHSDELRDARKVLFYAKAEVARLEKKCIG